MNVWMLNPFSLFLRMWCISNGYTVSCSQQIRQTFITWWHHFDIKDSVLINCVTMLLLYAKFPCLEAPFTNMV